MIVPGIFVCSSFLISVCMFIVPKALLISSVTVIVRAGGVGTERRDMGLYEVPLSMSLLGIGMGTMLANFPICGIMLVLRAVFNMVVRNGSPRGPICLGA